MPRYTPSSLGNTLSGAIGAHILHAADNLANSVRSLFNTGSRFDPVAIAIRAIGDLIVRWIYHAASMYSGSVPHYATWFTAQVYAADYVAYATSVALRSHWSWIHDIRDHRIPNVERGYRAADSWVLTSAELYTQSKVTPLSRHVDNIYAYARNYLTYLDSRERNDITSLNLQLRAYIIATRAGIERDITSARTALRTEYLRLIDDARTYAHDLYRSAMSSLHTAVLAIEAELAALSLFITTVAIPTAIEANNLANIAQIAAGTDELWPLVKRSATQASAKIADKLPTVAVRAAAIPPEPVPGLTGEAEAFTAAHAFTAAFIADGAAPLYDQLRDFGRDTQGLGGILGTALMTGLTVALIADPHDSASVVADAAAHTFVPAGVAILDAFGLRGD